MIGRCGRDDDDPWNVHPSFSALLLAKIFLWGGEEVKLGSCAGVRSTKSIIITFISTTGALIWASIVLYVYDTLCLGWFRSGLTNPRSCKSSGEIDCAGQWAFDVLMILTPRWCDTNLCGYDDDMRQNAIGWRGACFLPTEQYPLGSLEGCDGPFSSNFIFWRGRATEDWAIFLAPNLPELTGKLGSSSWVCTCMILLSRSATSV